ncbi:hypothetical protein [Pseudarthrobacter sp. H2]|uniref:hypothetical protein n=1 Tax=Pseudarthrobacter sp. H2 TaxID=3418415 RepID=UPI003CE68F55
MEILDRLRWRRQGLVQGWAPPTGSALLTIGFFRKVMYTMGFPRYALTQLVAQVT